MAPLLNQEATLTHWNIGPIAAIEPTRVGTKTRYVKTAAGAEFVLKTSDLDHAERSYRHALALSRTEVPVAVPITTEEGKWYVEDHGKVYYLSPWLPGATIDEPYEGDIEKTAAGLGRAIGLLHAGFLEYDDGSDEDVGLIKAIDEWAIPHVLEQGTMVDARAVERVWLGARSELDPLYGELPHHLIHRDAHVSNVLFSNGQLTGWIDLEMVLRGPRLFDVCYCAGSMLYAEYTDPTRARRWPGLFRSMVGGYETHYPLTAAERSAVYGLFVAIEILFMGFWVDRENEKEAKNIEGLLTWLADNRDALTG